MLIFSRDLEPELYDCQPFLAAVCRLALAAPQWPVRVLVFEPRLPVGAGHRLIGLARRLPSRIAIRRVAEDYRERTDAFLIADARSHCRRPMADRYEALLSIQNPADARRLRTDFQRIWDQSDEDVETRRLYL